MWKGAVRSQDADAYATYMLGTGVAGYAATPGNRGVWMLRRDLDDRSEFVMFTLWESLDAVRAFAGDDYERAVFYPEDERFLIERELTATHFEVAADGHAVDDRPSRLDGASVVLRPFVPDDLATIAAIQAEPGVARWWGDPDVEELIGLAGAAGADDRAFVIEHENEPVGLIQYYAEPDPGFRHAAIDIFLASRVQGRGLGPDALRTLARHLVEEHGHHRLQVDPAADNEQAIRAYAKAGFRRVGVTRQHWRSPDGDWRDGVLMELLASDLERG